MKIAFDDFEAHAAVVVRTLPETGVIVLEVDVALRVAAPGPFSVLPVDEIVLDVLPATQSFFQGILIAEILVNVEETYDGFGLYPPVKISIYMTCVEVCFVGHRAVKIKAFLAGFGNETNDGLHLLKHLFVAQYESRLMHEPRAFDVMTIAFEPTCTTRPIHLEKEVKMVGPGIEYLVAEDVDKLT